MRIWKGERVYVDVFGEEFVGGFVFLEEVGVDGIVGKNVVE